MRQIVLDTETTGFEPSQGHRLVEIGCVEMMNGMRTGKVFHTYLNPERDMPHEAFKVHGLSAEFLKDKALFKNVAEDFLAFIEDDQLIIHNAPFDMKFLNSELQQAGKKPLLFDRVIDTVLEARKKFPGAQANLDALCRRFNIDLSMRTKHGALLDAELLSEVYVELTGGKQSALTLEQSSSTDEITVEQETIPAIVRPARHFPPSDDEKAVHNTFLEKLPNAIWTKLQDA